MSAFDTCFEIVLGNEGGFTNDPRDPGNWTGGKVGRGQLRGTRYGISAASYPTLDIKALTPADARAIYKRDYWDRVRGDELPPAMALVVFDAAVNCGVSRGARWLQGAVGVKADGAIGPATLGATHRGPEAVRRLCGEMVAQRLIFMSGLPTWATFGTGWARRLCQLLIEAAQMDAGPPPGAARFAAAMGGGSVLVEAPPS